MGVPCPHFGVVLSRSIKAYILHQPVLMRAMLKDVRAQHPHTFTTGT